MNQIFLGKEILHVYALFTDSYKTDENIILN